MKPDECCFYCIIEYEKPDRTQPVPPEMEAIQQFQYIAPEHQAQAITMYKGTPVCMRHAKELAQNRVVVRTGYRGQVRAQYQEIEWPTKKNG